MKNNITIISGTANPELAKKVSKNLGAELTPVEIKNFNDGETYVRIEKSVRGSDVFIIQPTSSPSNDNLMELLILVDALKRASAKEITAVIPYYGYARQDRQATPREPITAKLVASLLETAGAHRVITFDLHVDQIQGFFNIPVDNPSAIPILARSIMKKKLNDIVIVSPDAGGATRARRFAKALGADMAIIDKRRSAPGKSKVMNLIGEVRDKNAILVDDIIDTGGTISNAASELKKQGAKDVYICATHPVFSNDAIKKLSNKDVKEVIVTDTISLPAGKKMAKIKVVTLAPLIAGLINSIFKGEPIEKIMEKEYNLN